MRFLGIILLLSIFTFSSSLLAGPMVGQTIIENPARPAASGTDRIVNLKEVLRITDEGGKYFFKSPSIQGGPDGSIFMLDDGQLLKFDPNGRFLRNYFHKGQGPGEVIGMGGFFPLQSGLMVQGAIPAKMVRYAEDGALIKENNLPRPFGGVSAIGKCGEFFVFRASESALAEYKGAVPGVTTVRSHIFTWTEQQAGLEEIGSFPGDVFVIKLSSGGGATYWISPIIAVPFGPERLVLTHQQKYLIKMIDVKSKTVVCAFRRPYESVKFEPPHGGYVINGVDYGREPKKFLSDIEGLFAVGDRLWVLTSTRDKEGNSQVDVFDGQGIYQDRFYIRCPAGAAKRFMQKGQCVIHAGFLYQIESLEDVLSVAKYEIKDPRSGRNP